MKEFHDEDLIVGCKSAEGAAMAFPVDGVTDGGVPFKFVT